MNQKLMLEGFAALALIALVYFGYSYLSGDDGSTTTTQTVDLGANFTIFRDAIGDKKLSFNMQNILNSDLAHQLQDFSQVIPPSEGTGRPDPFIPYANSRPLR